MRYTYDNAAANVRNPHHPPQRVDPESADVHNNLGAALASRGRVDEAADHFQQALDIRPAYADAERNLRQARRLLQAPR